MFISGHEDIYEDIEATCEALAEKSQQTRGTRPSFHSTPTLSASI